MALSGFKARAVARQYRHLRPTSVYASDAFADSLHHTVSASPLLGLLVTELSIPYYVVCGWFRRYQTTHATHMVISYHRSTGYGAVISLFTGLVVLETIGLHVLVRTGVQP